MRLSGHVFGLLWLILQIFSSHAFTSRCKTQHTHAFRIAKLDRCIYTLHVSKTAGVDQDAPLQLSEYADQDDDEELIKRLNKEIMAESGVDLDQLINPSKVVNLERDIINLSKALESTSVESEIEEIQLKISKKRDVLLIEKRSVMRGWLKNLFVGQSVLAGVISLAMVYNSVPGIDFPLPIKVLGFWMWWLFIIPSLRARKPSAEEKDALNIAFLATPLVSVAMPTFTKDVVIIWWANAVATAACYAYAYLKPKDTGYTSEEEGETERSSLPPFLVKAFKALDYGSGQERGLRK